MDRVCFAILVWRRHGAPALLILVLAVLTSGGSLPAAADDLFEVPDVKVDETDQTATAAREKALAMGERRAWDALLERLVDPQQRRPLPEFSQRDIGDAVKDFWVTQEKTSPVRYIATLNYTFRPERVRRLLAGRNLRFSTTRSPTVVVVPLYETQAVVKLWDDPNPWRLAWQGVRSPWLTPLRVPAGDLADLSTVGAEQALAGDRGRLSDLARRYDGTDTLVALAAAVSKPETGKSVPGKPDAAAPTASGPTAAGPTAASSTVAASRLLRVSATRYSPTAGLTLPERTYAFEGSEPSIDLLKQAAAAVASDLETEWRRGATAASDARPSSRTTVRVPAASLEEWVGLISRLGTTPQVGSLKVLSLSPEEGQVQIVYPGSPEQLTAALAQKGLVLRSEDGQWVLSDAATMQQGPEETPVP